MNDHRPYEQSLRDKLTKLPLPDVDQTWPAMRKLLDEEMPEGGGYSKRRGGWWMFSALLIFIIVGSWTILTMNFSKQNVDPPLSAAKQASPPGQQAKPNGSIQSEKPVAADDKILLSRKLSPDLKAQPSTSEGSTPVNSTSSNDVTSVASFHDGNIIEKPATVQPVWNRGNGSSYQRRPAASEKSSPESEKGNPAEGEKPPAIVNASNDALSNPAVEPTQSIGLQPFSLTSFATGFDSIEFETSKVVRYAPVSRKYYRQHKKYGKPVNIKEPYTTLGRNFAIGLSLPLAFPLGDQKALGYNVNAGHNTTTDYIPAPHVQYHLNSKAYVQSELQLMSPQFIRPVLLYQHQSANSTSSTTNSIYARKLYYFNVPVSVHYSPFKHFYMGTGLQFSSLLSGVAMHEQLRSGMVPGDSIYRVRYAKFGNDSISNKLNSNEMRLMLDANYYWNRFTVGLRYNQALSNYVSTRAAANIPYTLDKNKSLQFYMRYNLWEDKKRKNTSPRMVSLR